MQRLPGRVLARLATPDGLAAWRPAAVAAGRLCLASLSQQLGAALAPPQPPERLAAPTVEFCTLVTRPGDSLSEVARITRTPVHVLQSVNNLGGAAPLQAGQALLVPRSRKQPDAEASRPQLHFWLRQDRQSSGIAAEDGGKLVIANWGDSLWSLAERHNISIDDLRRSNGLPEGSSHLQLGQEVLIPSARALASPQPALSMAGLLQRWTDELPPVQFLLRPEALQGYPLLAALSSSALVSVMPKWRPEPFGLPVRGGWLSSYYGWKDKRWYFHNGIDIAVEEGTPITAASSGLVTYSDWKGGYGKTVCIDHGNGLSTLYAHCSDLAVRPGQFVRKGQAVARSGNTGHSTGPHLHFEIHRGGKTVDPLEEIPAIC
eukprot:SM000208S06326  [mRNA]  locus=s208:224652:226584:+ [translate_table: standard]